MSYEQYPESFSKPKDEHDIRFTKYVVSVDQLQSVDPKELNLPPELCQGFWSLNTHNQSLATPSDSLLASFFPYMIGPVFTSIRIRNYFQLLKSTIFWLIIIQSLSYFIALAYSPSPFYDFNISPMIIEKYGISLYYIKESRQYWRFITSFILHGSFSHLFIDVIIELAFILSKEILWKRWRFLIIFFLTYIQGVLVEILLDSSFFLGPSTGIFGVFGCFLGMYIVIVDKLPWNHKIGTLIAVVFVVIFLIILGNQTYIYNFAHFESSITGIFLGFCFFAHQSSSNKRKITLLTIGLSMTIIILSSIFLYFFFSQSPKKKPTLILEVI